MYQRNDRISELLFQEISQLLRSVKDPELSGFLTLTGIDLSPDRKNAKIFFSILGSAQDREGSARALERATPFLRYQLRSRIALKYIPKLQFFYDQTPERADRIERLLKHIETEQVDPRQDRRGPS
ncbi:MAG: 30S ribosome-binding factor RbfA [Elusimicrobia bacterium]|nr:30S ribosome-binding factor RbfA [Elusimicrobiota bacterium]